MSHIDCRFYLNNFELDSPWGEDDIFFLSLRGGDMALEFRGLPRDALKYLISEIEDGLRVSEQERKEHEVDELLYQPPELKPIKLCFVFEGLGGLQALYQPPDHLWQMVFDDDEDASQAHVMMSTQQVLSLLARLKGQIKGEKRKD